MNMKNLGLGMALALSACGPAQQSSTSAEAADGQANQPTVAVQQNQVVETIMARRSVRKYKPQPVEEEKLQEIIKCGINAPNGRYKQSWEVRIVRSPEFMAEIEKGYTAYQEKSGKKRINHPSFGAPLLVFIAYDDTYDLSQVDCGLIGANMILSAQSMGLGTCCLGGIARFMQSPEASSLLKRLDFPETHHLLYAISMGYPDETPGAKPRDVEKVKIID